MDNDRYLSKVCDDLSKSLGMDMNIHPQGRIEFNHSSRYSTVTWSWEQASGYLNVVLRQNHYKKLKPATLD